MTYKLAELLVKKRFILSLVFIEHNVLSSELSQAKSNEMVTP